MDAALVRIAGATTIVRTANGLSVNDPIASLSTRHGIRRTRIHNNFSMVVGRSRTRPMTAFVVDDVIRVDRIRHDYERLVLNRDQERLIPTDIVDVIDKPEVL